MREKEQESSSTGDFLKSLGSTPKKKRIQELGEQKYPEGNTPEDKEARRVYLTKLLGLSKENKNDVLYVLSKKDLNELKKMMVSISNRIESSSLKMQGKLFKLAKFVSAEYELKLIVQTLGEQKYPGGNTPEDGKARGVYLTKLLGLSKENQNDVLSKKDLNELNDMRMSISNRIEFSSMEEQRKLFKLAKSVSTEYGLKLMVQELGEQKYPGGNAPEDRKARGVYLTKLLGLSEENQNNILSKKDLNELNDMRMSISNRIESSPLEEQWKLFKLAKVVSTEYGLKLMVQELGEQKYPEGNTLKDSKARGVYLTKLLGLFEENQNDVLSKKDLNELENMHTSITRKIDDEKIENPESEKLFSLKELVSKNITDKTNQLKSQKVEQSSQSKDEQDSEFDSLPEEPEQEEVQSRRPLGH